LDTSITPRSPGVLGVKRYTNIKHALKYGGEFEIGIRPWNELLVSGVMSLTIGEDSSTGDPLPEIPPLESRVTIRYDDKSGKVWSELTGRFAAKQERISNEFGENMTPDFSVFDLSAGVNISSRITLRFGVRNIFDTVYYEHLNRQSKVDGLPIMESGRNVFVVLAAGS